MARFMHFEFAAKIGEKVLLNPVYCSCEPLLSIVQIHWENRPILYQ